MVIVYSVFGNIVFEIRFSYLVVGIELNLKVKGVIGNFGIVYLLIVYFRIVDIEIFGR